MPTMRAVLLFRMYRHSWRGHFHMAIKSLNFKKKLGKKMNSNRPLPNWVRAKTDNTVRYNSKRRSWRRTKLGINM